MKNNYRVTIRSRLGGPTGGAIVAEAHIEKSASFVGLLDATEWIAREATVGGWRNFTLETINQDELEKPLRERTEALV